MEGCWERGFEKEEEGCLRLSLMSLKRGVKGELELELELESEFEVEKQRMRELVVLRRFRRRRAMAEDRTR